MKITLVQPKYPHGGTDKRQTYLPGNLMNLGSRLIASGLEVDFIDLNHAIPRQMEYSCTHTDIIGFTALGPPYIPSIIKMIRNLRSEGFTQPILVGGEGVSRIKPAHFRRWFKGLSEVHQVIADQDIELACHIKIGTLPSAYNTSMVPMLRRLSEKQLRRYLTTEFPIFLSQGCKFSCAFCSAAKSRAEQYRTLNTLTDEMEFICTFLRKIGVQDLHAYLTNLDGFQTPKQLEACLGRMESVCARHGLTQHLRCLATSRCTFNGCEADHGLAERLRKLGLEIVAFGADGADEDTWKRQNKKHNVLSEIQTACKYMEDAGITVELLMVIGFDTDGPRALWRDLKYSLGQAWRGRIIRPYLAKTNTPSGRWLEGTAQVEAILNDSRLLSRLDYAMIGSWETHPDFWQRIMVNGVYLAIIGILAPFGKCPTRPLVPGERGLAGMMANAMNTLMPFDR